MKKVNSEIVAECKLVAFILKNINQKSINIARITLELKGLTIENQVVKDRHWLVFRQSVTDFCNRVIF